MAEDFPKDIRNATKTENIMDNAENALLEQEISASPLKNFNLDDALKMKEQMESMILSHETALNDNFILTESVKDPNSLEVKVKEVMEKAFWDILQEELSESPPNYKQALVLLQEIKEQLLELLLQTNNSIRSLIEEVLDLDLIKQKLGHSVFDLNMYSNFIIDTLGQLCAPIRDEDVARLRSIDGVVLLYREIFRVIDLMKLDYANFKLKAIRPYLKQHSAKIELSKFMDILKIQFENGIDGLLYTKLWLSDSFNFTLAKQLKLLQDKTTTTPSATTASSQQQPPTTTTILNEFLSSPNVATTILNNAYIRLLTNSIEYPETLLVDAKRLSELKDKFGSLILVSSVLVVSAATIGRPLDDAMKSKLKSQLFVLTENVPHSKIREISLGICDQIVKELNDWLVSKQHVPAMSEDMERSLRGQLEILLDPNSPCDPIFKLMGQRLCTFILEVISNTKDTQVPRGYSFFTDELSSLVRTFSTMVCHNQAVFGGVYQGIIWDLIRKYQDEVNKNVGGRIEDTGVDESVGKESNVDNHGRNCNMSDSNVDRGGSSVDK